MAEQFTRNEQVVSSILTDVYKRQSIEFEGMEPVFDALRIGLANLKKYWAEV